MLSKVLFNGVYIWLRKGDLNPRPLGYELLSIQSLNFEKKPFNNSLCRYNRDELHHKFTIFYLFYLIFCQIDKTMTKNNCTNNCTAIKLKEKYIHLYLMHLSYIFNSNILFYIFTTSRPKERPHIQDCYSQSTIKRIQDD